MATKKDSGEENTDYRLCKCKKDRACGNHTSRRRMVDRSEIHKMGCGYYSYHKYGPCIRFNEGCSMQPKNFMGVRGMNLADRDEVVGMQLIHREPIC